MIGIAWRIVCKIMAVAL